VGGFDVIIVDAPPIPDPAPGMLKMQLEFAHVTRPDEVFFVADARTGSEAARAARAIHGALRLTGVVLTRMDEDREGGALLSMRKLSGVPVRYLGTGPRPEDFEEFHPDRLTERILGRGDIPSLVEEVPPAVDQEAVSKCAEALFAGTFTMDDFLGLFEHMKKLGPLKEVLAQAGPGLAQLAEGMSAEEMECQMAHTKAMILSMTPAERSRPDVMGRSRQCRIARGSGTALDDVNDLLKEFQNTRKMYRQIGREGPGAFIAQREPKKRAMRRRDGRGVVCERCGAPYGLVGVPVAGIAYHDSPVFEVRYACQRPGCSAPDIIFRVPEADLTPEERRRLNRWE
jgi:signal recognition particle subunit SRP54